MTTDKTAIENVNQPSHLGDVIGSVSLITVPNYQKDLFKTYDWLEKLIQKTELMDYSMFENNLFGINERFLNWKSDLNGLVDDYVQNYILQPDLTKWVGFHLDLLLEHFVKNEYFEIAHNLHLILKSYNVALLAQEKGYKEAGFDWY